MSDWLLNLPVLWMGALILGAIYACTAGLYVLITGLAVGERYTFTFVPSLSAVTATYGPIPNVAQPFDSVSSEMKSP